MLQLANQRTSSAAHTGGTHLVLLKPPRNAVAGIRLPPLVGDLDLLAHLIERLLEHLPTHTTRHDRMNRMRDTACRAQTVEAAVDGITRTSPNSTAISSILSFSRFS